MFEHSNDRKELLYKALSEDQEDVFDPIFYAESMLQRYMPGLATSQLTDELLFKKYRFLMYMLKTEGVDVVKMKSLGSD